MTNTLTIMSQLAENVMDIYAESDLIPDFIDNIQEEMKASELAEEDRTIKIMDLTFVSVAELFLVIGTIIKNVLSETAKEILSTTLGFVSLVLDLITLGKNSYEVHQSLKVKKSAQFALDLLREQLKNVEMNNDNQEELIELEKKFEEISEENFKNEVEVAYRTLYVISSILGAASFACPVLTVISAALFFTIWAIEHFDKKSDLKFSRFIAKKWNELFHTEKESVQIKKTNPEHALLMFSRQDAKKNILDIKKNKKHISFGRFFDKNVKQFEAAHMIELGNRKACLK